MKVNRALFFFFFSLVLITNQAWAQDKNMSTRLIKYDPLFWKSELHLNVTQSSRIREINHKFYEEIQDNYNKYRNDHTELKAGISESLKNRSQRIWETLDTRQRRKLEKIMNGDYHS